MTFGVVLAGIAINCWQNFYLGIGRREIEDDRLESGGGGDRDVVTERGTALEEVVVDEGKERLLEER